jgi:hypothetical protein
MSYSQMFPEPSYLLGTSIVTPYKNLSGDSGIASYEIGADFIKVGFRSGPLYLYTYQTRGTQYYRTDESSSEGGPGTWYFHKHDCSERLRFKIKRIRAENSQRQCGINKLLLNGPANHVVGYEELLSPSFGRKRQVRYLFFRAHGYVGL